MIYCWSKTDLRCRFYCFDIKNGQIKINLTIFTLQLTLLVN